MTTPWSPGYFPLVVVMWAVMMVAMMLPSAAPMILLYATSARRRRAQGEAVAATSVFVLGYAAVWTSFSFVATTLQWGLGSGILKDLANGNDLIVGTHRSAPAPQFPRLPAGR